MRIVSILALMLLFGRSFAQQNFSLRLTISGKMDPAKVSCSYFDGKTEVLVSDSIFDRILLTSGTFHSTYAVFKVDYLGIDSNRYSSRFFISRLPADVSMDYDRSISSEELIIIARKNIVPMYDTSVLFYKEISHRRMKESAQVSEFWEKYGSPFLANDSLRSVFGSLYKSLNAVTIDYFRENKPGYYAYWYFKEQVVYASMGLLGYDTAYLKTLPVIFKDVFPRKYVSSPEGKALLDELEGASRSRPLSKKAPSFVGKDVEGNKVRLKDYRNRYVLLDFWASWCAPCLKELPELKKLRAEFPEDKLVILGISGDRNMSDLKNAIAKHKIPWTNIFEGGRRIELIYHINAIPTTILINDHGEIVYNSAYRNDKDELMRLLRQIR